MPIVSTARETVERLDRELATLVAPRHKLMLQAFRTHWWSEVLGDLDSAMSVLPKNSHFRVRGLLPTGGELAVDTAVEHRACYQALLDMGLNVGGAFYDERYAFAEWGLMLEGVMSNVLYGSMLANIPGLDPAGLYLVHTPLTIVAPFDPAGQMLGERSYMGAPLAVEPADLDLMRRMTGL